MSKSIKVLVICAVLIGLFNTITLVFVFRFHNDVLTFMKAINSTVASFQQTHEQLIKKVYR